MQLACNQQKLLGSDILFLQHSLIVCMLQLGRLSKENLTSSKKAIPKMNSIPMTH